MSCCMPTIITTKNMEKSIIVLDVRDSLPYYLTTIFWAMTENIGVDGSKIVCLNGFSSDIYVSFSEKIFGFIISCSHKSVLDIKIEKPFKKYLTKLIRYYHGKKPILGIGYGHQLLALALGGKIKTNKSKEELGSKKIFVTKEAKTDKLFSEFNNGGFVQECHKDYVSKLPSGATLLAYNDNSPIQAFRHGISWGVQFYPEIDNEFFSKQLKERMTTELENNNYKDVKKILTAIEGLKESNMAVNIIKKFIDFCMEDNQNV